MRIAAGVLLIFAAIINGCAGSTYAITGAVSSAASEGLKNVPDKVEGEDGTEVTINTEESKKAAAELEEATGGFFMLGIFLFIVMGLQIGGAVVLFMKKAANFVLVVGGLGIVAEVWGAVTSSFGLMNIIGLAASILAILAAMGLKKAGAGGGAAPA